MSRLKIVTCLSFFLTTSTGFAEGLDDNKPSIHQLLNPSMPKAQMDKSIDTKKQSDLKQYYESGNYFKDIQKQLVEAKGYLDRQLQLQDKQSNRLAVVLDIDETALSNYRAMERLSFTNNTSAISAIYIQANADPILPVLEFYQYAINKGVAVFFISARPNSPEFVVATAQNLKKAGFTMWEELILKPLDKDNLSTQDFKIASRKDIAAKGFDVILNIGDQTADLEGGYAQARVRIPNPFYELA